MNRDEMRRRAKELEAEIQQKTADVEAEKITKADYREFVAKALEESDEIESTLKAYDAAKKHSGGTEAAPQTVDGNQLQQWKSARAARLKEFSDTYAELKSYAANKRRGSFSLELGEDLTVKSQGDTGMMGENAYGTTGGVAISDGTYFLPGTAGPDILPQFIPGILELRWYDNVVASLWPTFPTDSPVVSYLRESGWTNNATAVNEGQTFPYSTNAITRHVAQLGKVGNMAKITDEMVQDSRYFLALVQKRTPQGVSREEEVQILAGSGFPGVEGLLGLSTSFTQPQTVTAVTNLVVPASGTPGEGASSATISSVTPGRTIGTAPPTGSQIAIGIFAMLTDIRVTHFFEPTAIVMNPYDWFTLRTWTDNNGQFMAGSPWNVNYGQSQANVPQAVQAVDPQLDLWGKRVCVTPAIPQGLVLVGDFQNGGQLLRKGGMRVELVNTNVDDFEKGLWSMRAYTRVGLAVERPELFELAQFHA